MAERLIDRFDAVLSDLDGVVYAGPHAIPGAPEALRRISADGVPVVFVTNNASRSVATVAEHLTDLGVPTGPEGVVSAAQAGAELLAQRVPSGTRVLVTGSRALADVVADAGLVPVRAQSEEPRAVIQGFDPGLGWAELAEAAYTLADPDVLWVATNTDRTIPQARGLAPGNGTLVAAVAATTARPPLVAGKPEAPIFRTAAERAGSTRPVVLGDRLDTDIRGGNAAGFSTVAVLTGVDTVHTILAACTAERPDHVVETLEALFEPYPEAVATATEEGHTARCGAAEAATDGTRLRIRGDRDDLDAWRAACAAWWAAHPDTDVPTDPDPEWGTGA
ncbi:HAD-IIA family hydrolase [Kocuria sp. CPCC 205268]|uniref:HAD-IIA family hydrolase n=1 Tax=Kocuria oxytropis TaxID=3058913 RepID=UPI0034D46902